MPNNITPARKQALQAIAKSPNRSTEYFQNLGFRWSTLIALEGMGLAESSDTAILASAKGSRTWRLTATGALWINRWEGKHPTAIQAVRPLRAAPHFEPLDRRNPAGSWRTSPRRAPGSHE